jgi:predicted homoserine dehydrogenase-like protein
MSRERSRRPTAPRNMNTRTAIEALAQTANVISAAESVATALQALRNGTTEDQWDQLCENELIDGLIDACMDLEFELED